MLIILLSIVLDKNVKKKNYLIFNYKKINISNKILKYKKSQRKFSKLLLVN